MDDNVQVTEEKISPNLYIQVTLEEIVKKELTTGSTFGHEMVYTLEDTLYSTYNASTLTYTEVHYLRKKDFFHTIKHFPDPYQELIRYAFRRGWHKYKLRHLAEDPMQVDDKEIASLQEEVSMLRRELQEIERAREEKDALVRKLIE